jgi:hypothetical protein
MKATSRREQTSGGAEVAGYPEIAAPAPSYAVDFFEASKIRALLPRYARQTALALQRQRENLDPRIDGSIQNGPSPLPRVQKNRRAKDTGKSIAGYAGA